MRECREVRHGTAGQRPQQVCPPFMPPAAPPPPPQQQPQQLQRQHQPQRQQQQPQTQPPQIQQAPGQQHQQSGSVQVLSQRQSPPPRGASGHDGQSLSARGPSQASGRQPPTRDALARAPTPGGSIAAAAPPPWARPRAGSASGAASAPTPAPWAATAQAEASRSRQWAMQGFAAASPHYSQPNGPRELAIAAQATPLQPHRLSNFMTAKSFCSEAEDDDSETTDETTDGIQVFATRSRTANCPARSCCC